MIEARIVLVIETEKGLDGKCRKLVLIIQNQYGRIKVTIYGESIQFMCKQAKVKTPSELAGKKVMLDPDANFSCIYIIIKKKGRASKLMPVACEISLVKNYPRQ